MRVCIFASTKAKSKVYSALRLMTIFAIAVVIVCFMALAAPIGVDENVSVRELEEGLQSLLEGHTKYVTSCVIDESILTVCCSQPPDREASLLMLCDSFLFLRGREKIADVTEVQIECDGYSAKMSRQEFATRYDSLGDKRTRRGVLEQLLENE